MTTRLTIVNELFADLNAALSGFVVSVHDTRVGVFDPEEMAMLPALGLWTTEDTVEDDLMDDTVFRRLVFILYGYVDANAMDNYTKFYNLINDCEHFLYSTSNRRYENTYLGNVVITYGGATEQTGMFVLNFSILYSQSGLES